MIGRIRSAQESDAKDILRVVNEAFHKNLSENSEKYREELQHITAGVAEWRILILDGRVSGTVHIGCEDLKIGRAYIRKGDVGEVAIVPEYQGKGYGNELLKDTVSWMKKERYDISRLGGLRKFYRRFGYLRFPRRYVEFSVGGKWWAGASLVEEGEIPLEKSLERRIRPFNRRKDELSYQCLCKKFNQSYVGFQVVSTNPGFFFVFVENNKVLGYISGYRYEKEMTQHEARITITEAGYQRNKPYAFQSLIQYIYNHAFREGISRITGRLPFDPEVIGVLSELPVRFQIVEAYGGSAGNMLQIVNLGSLLTGLIPELKARLKTSLSCSYTGVLEIQIEKDKVQLSINCGDIAIVEKSDPDIVVHIKEFYLLQLILGMLSFSEVRGILNKKITLSPTELLLLNDLFPRRLVYSGNWG
jgi:predicted N-acetyltransferase YhbS